MMRENRKSERIEWSIRVPIFSNSIILKQLGIAIGIPFGILTIFLLIISKEIIYTTYALGLITTLFLLTYLFIRIVWRGNYDVGFVMDQKGIRCYTQSGQAKRNRIINLLTVILGLFSGKPGVAGAGLLAQSRQDILIRWKNIRKIKYNPKRYEIMIKGGFAENIALFCTKENYDAVINLLNNNKNGGYYENF